MNIRTSSFHFMVTAAIGATSTSALGDPIEIVSTFAGGSTHGWSGIGRANVRGDGSYGGTLAIEDEAGYFGDVVLAQASSLFSGDLRAFSGGTLSFDVLDYNHMFYSGGDPIIDPSLGMRDGFGTVMVSGPGGTMSADLVTGLIYGEFLDPANPAVRGNISIPFSPAAWGMSEGEWSSILGNVTSITVDYDARDGFSEVMGLDTFRLYNPEGPPVLSPVPLPTPVLMGVTGLLGIASLRGRREWLSAGSLCQSS